MRIENRLSELGLTLPEDLILKLWGPDAGSHARSAVGMAELPFSIPVEIEAEVAIDG